jgi:anti-anti-sigma factor
VIKAEVRFDSVTASELEKKLTDLVPSGKDIVLDMTGITFVSSAGWWAIIKAQKELKKRNRDLVLVNINENVKDSMDLIGILPYFTVYENMVDALGNL